MENLGLTKDKLYEHFLYRCNKMINLYADYPGLFKFYGSFIKTWCMEKNYFELSKLLDTVVLGNEDEDDEYYDR